tara:strand:- start:5036 stop:5425 length:390 start_codon:yes stop_codon:yes gene_type:complete
MKDWSKSWSSSKNPAKQRKFRYKAPLNILQKFMHVHLSPELRKKHNFRRVMVKKGDTVTVVRGQHRKKSGKVTRVMLKQEKVFIEGIERSKGEGAVSPIALKASNLMITSLDLEDKRRKKKLDSKKEKK